LICTDDVAKENEMKLNQVTVPALDMERSTQFYETLGLRKIVANEHYARFRCPGGDSTFSIELVDTPSAACSIVVYFEIDNLDLRVTELKSAGLIFTQDPKDEPWLWREAYLNDPAGNVICLYFAGKNRLDPPWRLDDTD
jgi:catechol 2,3-dioxygenase-like lactoylglutathione lyase family enzyme